MGPYERERLLQLLAGEDEYSAYQAMFEAAASALTELEGYYAEKRHDQIDSLLTVWSRLLEHICFQLDGEDHSIVFEAGKLCGIISTFECLFRKEQQYLIIDAAIAELLSNSKPASKQILRILYEAQQNEEWVPRSTLIKKSEQSQNSLSNIMKRLLRAQAVDFYKEGKEVSYRLTAAGIRYYEKNISPSMNDPAAMELGLLREEINGMKNTISGLAEQMNRQTSTIGEIKRNLIYHLEYDKSALQNNIDHSDYGDTELAVFSKTINSHVPFINNVDSFAIKNGPSASESVFLWELRPSTTEYYEM